LGKLVMFFIFSFGAEVNFGDFSQYTQSCLFSFTIWKTFLIDASFVGSQLAIVSREYLKWVTQFLFYGSLNWFRIKNIANIYEVLIKC